MMRSSSLIAPRGGRPRPGEPARDRRPRPKALGVGLGLRPQLLQR